jgi:membrane-associated phospholipid phosphatase
MRPVLKPSDLLTFFFLALIGCLALYSAPVNPAWSGLLATCVLLALAVLGAAAYRTRVNPARKGLYLSVAVTTVTVLVIFNGLGELIASLHATTCDGVLIAIDHAIFGVHPTVWMERLVSPALSILLQLAYLSFYGIPLALGCVLIAKGRFGEFEEVLFGILLCFYLSYLGYLLFPAVGPRVTLRQFQGGGLQVPPFIAALQETLDGLEKNKTDAFPSGHTAISLLSLYYAWAKGEKVLFAYLLPLVSALVVSTVYLRYHYVIDVIAGVALTGLTIVLAPWLRRLLSGASGQRQ